MRATVRALLIGSGFALFATAARGAPSLPAGFTIVHVAPGAVWESPVGVAFTPDGRTFVIEKRGRVHVVKNGVRLSTPFLDLESEVLNNGDRGLLGIALDPGYATRPHVYLLYTVDPDADGVDDEGVSFGRVTRYRASSSNPDRADASTRQVLIGATWPEGIPSLSSTHTVGCLRFAADGTLLITAGDGAAASGADAGGRQTGGFTPSRFPDSEDIGAFRSQSLSSLAGKLLRIDPDTGLGLPSNPYYTGNGAAARSRVLAYGLRNPYRFCVRPGTGSSDPADGRPGSIYVGDVGWHDWEEVSVSRQGGGENFGWPCREGFEDNPDYEAIDSPFDCDTPGTAANPAEPEEPILAWHHWTASQSTPPGLVGKAVSGVAFYAGQSYPAAYRGACFLADYNSSWIKAARVDSSDRLVSVTDFATDAGGPVDLAADPSTGDIVCVSLTDDAVFRIRYTGSNRAPSAAVSASPLSGPAPLAVQFSSAGSSDPDGDALTFRWAFGDGGTATGASVVHTYASQGAWQAALTADDGKGGEDTETITIVVGGTASNAPPAATILEPANEDAFDPEGTITLRGSGSDPEDSAAALRFAWQVLLHHNTHVHPDWLFLSGPTASFAPGDHDDGTGTHLEIRLTVTDTGGLGDMKKVFVFPGARPIIVEDGDPGTSSTGSWGASGGPFPHGARSIFSAGQGDTYSYRVALPSAGDYKVYAWWTVLPSRGTSVPYAVEHASGTEQVRVNQREKGYQWNDLGTYAFSGEARVTITAVGGESTCADAICFVPQGTSESTPEAHIHAISPNPAAAGEPVSFEGEAHSGGPIASYRWSSSIDGFLSDRASFVTSSLSAGVHTISFRAIDSRGAASPDATQVLEVRSSTAAEVILDDGRPGTTPSGGWSVSSGANPYGGGSVYSKSAGASYRFQLALPSPGIYDVHAWWTTLPSRTTAAPYVIAHAAGSDTVRVNQLAGAGRWNYLGTYAFGTSGRVTIQSVGNGFSTCADAIRFVQRAAERIIDDGDPGTSFQGSWTTSGGANPYGPRSIYAKHSSASYTWSFAATGTHEVLVWWTTLASRSTKAAYRVARAGGSTTVTANQRLNGGKWNSLGLFDFDGSGSVTLLALPDGASYCADAVRVRRAAP